MRNLIGEALRLTAMCGCLAVAACSSETEDDRIFAAIGELETACGFRSGSLQQMFESRRGRFPVTHLTEDGRLKRVGLGGIPMHQVFLEKLGCIRDFRSEEGYSFTVNGAGE